MKGQNKIVKKKKRKKKICVDNVNWPPLRVSKLKFSSISPLSGVTSKRQIVVTILLVSSC